MAQIKQLDLSNFFQCDQVWENMPICEKGRICQECNKVLIDFRNLSDQEVSDIHNHSQESICGIYKRHQISIIDTLNPQPSLVSKWKVLGIGLAGILFSQNANSQHPTEPIEVNQSTSQTKTTEKQTTSNSSKDKIIIYGKITSGENEELIGANVYVKNFNIGTHTDIVGNYRLDITEALDSLPQVTIIYHYIGFQEKELIFSRNNATKLNIVMTEGLMLDELIVTGFYVPLTPPSTFWQRVSNKLWNLFNHSTK